MKKVLSIILTLTMVFGTLSGLQLVYAEDDLAAAPVDETVIEEPVVEDTVEEPTVDESIVDEVDLSTYEGAEEEGVRYEPVADTTVKKNAAAGEFGQDATLIANGITSSNQYAHRTLMKFNLDDLIGKEVDSATLNLYLEDMKVLKQNDGSITPSVQDGYLTITPIIEKEWTEDTAVFQSYTPDESLEISDIDILLDDGVGRWISIDITDIVNRTFDKVVALLIEGETYGGSYRNTYTFASRESENKPYIERSKNAVDLDYAVQSVTLDKESVTITKELQTTEQLSATVSPSYATNKNIVWKSDDETVATVDKTGLVTVVNVGECIITASAEENPEKSDTCTINVVSLGKEDSEEFRYGSTHDTNVNEGWQDLINGGNTVVSMRNSGGQVRKGFLKFDIPELEGYDIQFAALQMTTAAVHDDIPVTIYGLYNTNWEEMKTNWINAPDTFYPNGVIKDPVQLDKVTVPYLDGNGVDKTYSWDVTKYVKEMPGGSYSFRINTQTGNKGTGTSPEGDNYDSINFYAKEKGENVPTLYILARPYDAEETDNTITLNQLLTEIKKPWVYEDTATQPMAKGTLILADYNENGRMTNVISKSGQVAPDESTTLSLTSTLPENMTNQYTKFFFWESLQNAIPKKIDQKYKTGCEEYTTGEALLSGVQINGDTIHIKGKTNNPGEEIGIIVTKPGVDPATINDANIVEKTSKIDQITTDSNGQYSFAYNISDADFKAETGYYQVIIGGNKSGAISTSEFYYMNSDEASQEKLVKLVGDAETIPEAKSIIIPNAYLFGFAESEIFSDYFVDTYTAEKQDALIAKIVEKLGQPNAAASDIVDTIVLDIVSNTTSAQNIESFNRKGDNKYLREIGGGELIKELNKLTTTQQMEVAKTLRNTTFSTVDDYLTALAKAIDDNTPAPTPTKGTGGGGTGGTGGGNNYEYIPNPIPTPTPTPIPNDQVEKFTDLAGYDWAVDGITALAKKGIINGKGDGKFAPGDNVTREEFVKMIINGFGLTDKTATCSYTDVDSSEWYYVYIATATKLGIINGVSDTEFGIGQQITRQDMAVIAYRAAQVQGIKLAEAGELTFTDKDAIADYAVEAVRVMQASNVITGMETGAFEPESAANRAQAAVIINRLLNR